MNALAEALTRSEQFERALPLLVTATTRAGAQPDATMLYLRGLAEFNTGKRADAERSFNAAIKADPKNTAALFYLGRIAYEQKNWDNAIAMFNRATTYAVVRNRKYLLHFVVGRCDNSDGDPEIELPPMRFLIGRPFALRHILYTFPRLC